MRLILLVVGLSVCMATMTSTRSAADDVGSIAVEIVGRRTCAVESADDLYDEQFDLIERYTNVGERPIEFVDVEKTTPLVYLTQEDAQGDRVWLSFGTDFDPVIPNHLPTYAVRPGETSVRRTTVAIVVRRAAAPAATWPLGPGRYFMRVIAERTRLAVETDDRKWTVVPVELRSPPFSIVIEPRNDVAKCD